MGAATGVAKDSAPYRPFARRVGEWLALPLAVRTYLIGLSLAVVLPLLAFSAFLVLRSAEHEQELLASTVRERSHVAAAAIDDELSLLRARLFALASSVHLQIGNLADFHTQAMQMVKDTPLSVVLSDPDGQELVNTHAPFGRPLPLNPDLEAIRRVVTTGEPYISDLTVGAVSGGSVLALNVPVFAHDRLAYVLSLNIADYMPYIVAQLRLPDEWLAAIADRNGRTLARSRDAARFVGQLSSPAAIARFRAENDGWFPSRSRDGIPIYNAFMHIHSAGWVVDIGMPVDILFAPVRRSTMILVLVGAVTVGVALAIASLFQRQVARPINALVAYAGQVGQGERLPLLATGIVETDAVAHSLHQASEQLHRNAEARDAAERELRASEQRYRALAEALVVANEERRELLHRTVETQESERRRIARELHDSFGQYLTALRLGFTAIEPACAANPCAQQRLTELKKLTVELGRDFSRMAWELRPTALDDLGLRNAITQYLEEWAERSGLEIDAEITIGERRLPIEVETALFRVLQEAITNVVKHSDADRVGVILEATNDEVRLIVEDDGHGFRVGHGRNVALDSRHLGLLGVRERLALVGGSLEVESAPDSGTTVFACVPLAGATSQ